MRRSVIHNLPGRVLFWSRPAKACYIDRLPIEVLEPISVLACTSDNGSTGCALSRVSRRMRSATRAGRFTSVALSLRTRQQLASFLACFIAERARVDVGYSTPKIRHLFLASAKRTLKAGEPGAEEELISYQKDVSYLIELVAADLYSLLVYHELGYHNDLPLPDIGLASYPLLEQLSLFGCGLRFVPPPRREWEDDDAVESNENTPCLPRLTHLQLTKTDTYGSYINLGRWTREAPCITHLFLANIDYPDDWTMMPHLRKIVNIEGPDSLKDLQVLILQPTAAPPFFNGTCGTPRRSYRHFAFGLSELHEGGVRQWALLPALKRSTGPKHFEQAARKEWSAWQQGRLGCWSVNRSYYRA